MPTCPRCHGIINVKTDLFIFKTKTRFRPRYYHFTCLSNDYRERLTKRINKMKGARFHLPEEIPTNYVVTYIHNFFIRARKLGRTI